MKKKYLFLFLILIFLFSLALVLSLNKTEINNIVTIGQNYKAINSEIAIKYQEEDGNYKDSTDGSWPDGYYLNPEKSNCKSNTTIGYDTDTDKIIFKGDHPDRCSIYLDKETTLANYIKSIFVYDGYNNIYYHDGKGDYINAQFEAEDFSYRYAGGGYSLTDKAIEEGYKTGYGIIKGNYGNGYQINDYAGSNQYRLEYNQQKIYNKLKDAIQEAIKDNYLVENELNNYVCFGFNQRPCPEENLYRIVGVIPTDVVSDDNKITKESLVKLVKADVANSDILGKDGNYKRESTPGSQYLGNKIQLSSYSFNDEANNNFSESELITKNLNINYANYLKNLDGNWFKKIAKVNWKVGATISSVYSNTIKNFYKYEFSNNTQSLVIQFGVPYESDYLYAASPKYWNLTAAQSPWGGDIPVPKDYRDSIYGNWLFFGANDTLLFDIRTDIPQNIVRMTGYGNAVDIEIVSSSNNNPLLITIIPTFYLKADVKYVSGDGSIDNPFIID